MEVLVDEGIILWASSVALPMSDLEIASPDGWMSLLSIAG
jgi:hypothetical protein